MKNIKKISYSYGRDFNNPIIYYIQTDTITTSLNYNDALEITYAFIDSLNGSYEWIDDLVDKFNKERNKGIKIEEI